MPMHKVKVTQEDIDSGIVGDPCKCALAKALCRMPDIRRAEVVFEHITLWISKGADGKRKYGRQAWVVIPHRRESTQFYRDFDKRGKKVEPCTIELEW